MIRIMTALHAAVMAQTLAMSDAAAGETKPLFADDAVISLKIIAPFSELVRKAPYSTDSYPATLILGGDEAQESHAIILSARGKSRRDKKLCKFPPLRVEFKDKPGDESLFDGQKRLKLVTHCRRSSAYEQYYVKEYAAYKLLNAMTPLSLNVRMAKIEYVKERNGKTLDRRFGFFIEDIDHAAKRNGMKELEAGDVAVEQLDPSAAGTYAVFQYMIGNLDWSMRYAPEDDDCCHNTKLMGENDEAMLGIVPVPYDFDYSGLVNASYAVPPESVNVRSVKTRQYRGFCIHNSEARMAATQIYVNKAKYFELIDAIEPLDDRTKRGALRYLESFFQDISSAESIEKNLFSRCRG